MTTLLLKLSTNIMTFCLSVSIILLAMCSSRSSGPAASRLTAEAFSGVAPVQSFRTTLAAGATAMSSTATTGGLVVVVSPGSSRSSSSSSKAAFLPSPLYSSNVDVDDDDELTPIPPTAVERLENMKRSLIRECERVSPDKNTVLGLVRDVEEMGEQVGIGQGTAVSGLMAGQWSLAYASEDVTRSSPFFWAFRKTFPQNAEEVFAITDAIPAPIKETGPATQVISERDQTLVSRVKVATLNGVATSVMTTRCTILGPEGLDVLRVRVDTTKPEKSTILSLLGPLGTFVDDNVARPFPSGEALEKVRAGGSEVRIRTTFCDEGLRISRDGELVDGDTYVWVRDTFEAGSEL